MRHIRAMSRQSGLAESIAPEVKLTFIRDVVDASIPLFEDKDVSNSTTDTGNTD